MLGFVLLGLCLLFLMFSYEKTTCFFVAFYPLLCMVGITNSINLFHIVSIFCIFVYWAKYFKKKDNKNAKYPFNLTIVFVCLAYFATNIINEAHWPTTIAIVSSEYILTIVFWNLMKNPVNRDYFFKCFIVFISIVCCYCIVEYILQFNPLYIWYVNSSIFTGYDANRLEDIRFGSMRCHSIMRDVGALGTVCCTSICILYQHYLNYKQKTSVMLCLYFVIASLCIICTFLTGTRTVILSLILVLIIIFCSLKIKFKIRATIIALVVIVAFSEYLGLILDAFIDTQSVVGSSAQMRDRQMSLVFDLFQRSPLCGIGLSGTEFVINRYADAYGLESSWFQLLVNLGLLGVISFAVSIYQGLSLSIKLRNIAAIAMAVMFLVVKTMSSIPGIGLGYFLFIIIYLIANQNQSRTNENRNYYNA